MQRLIQSILKIVSGTASAQIIMLLAMPLITRFYLPEDYGIFGTIIAFATIIAIIASFQLHQAIILTKIEKHAVALSQASSLSLLIGSILTSIFAYIYLNTAKENNSTANTLVISTLMGASVLAIGIGQISQGLAVRRKMFGSIGLASIIRTSTVIISQITLGLFNIGGAGLTTLVKKYKDFTSFGTAQEATSAISLGAPLILMSVYFDSTVAGYYAFAFKILMAPVNIISGAIRQVLSIQFAENSNSPAVLKKQISNTTKALIATTLPIFIIISFFTPDIFEFTFGSEWRMAGIYSSYLLPWCSFIIFSVPSTLIFKILRQQKTGLIINIAVLIARLAVIIIGGYIWTASTTVIAFSLIGALTNLSFIVFAKKFLLNQKLPA